MFRIPHIPKPLIVAALLASCSTSLVAQDASQLGFTTLQSQANALVEKGQLIEAQPYLEELIKRVEKDEDTELALDFPIFLVGTAHIQKFVSSGVRGELESALKWYAKLEKEYPDSPKLKDAILKKIDVLRILGRTDDAVALMEQVLSDKYPFRLSFSERESLLQDITETYYGAGKLAEGLPYFGQLIEIARDPEDQALAAAASFEALIQAERIDDALRLIPNLALESEVRYNPRLNVAFLTTSDKLVDQERLTDAAILLNLIKTTDIMISYYEDVRKTKKAALEQKEAFGSPEEELKELTQEIANTENTLKQLRKLPTLRNELLVRRARNYTKTGRKFEAFWMFYDLMVENPKAEQIQFYTYASFSNARLLGKQETMVKIGEHYLQKYPNGEYFSDVAVAMVSTYREAGNDEAFLALSLLFLDGRPIDAVSPAIFAEWAGYMLENTLFEEMIDQIGKWKEMHRNPIFADALYYWEGLAQLQVSEYAAAIENFEYILQNFKGSAYEEDSLLRKGAGLFYLQQFNDARDILTAYTEKYPQGEVLDQAYYFLGEIEFLAGNYKRALAHFQKSDSITTLQDVHDGVTFRIAEVYEILQDYDKMVALLLDYIEKYGDKGRLTDAVFELGRGYEFQTKPNEMLAIYREYIDRYISIPENSGVDTLIEGYAEKYAKNLTLLEETVVFLDALDNDLDFRKKIVSDRGYLFEYFYLNQEVDQALYNRLRNHPNYSPALAQSLAPISNLTNQYRDQLANYPKESPEDYFKRSLKEQIAANSEKGEARALMGLYRIGTEITPRTEYSEAFFESATPRLLLYVADYSRDKDLDFSVRVWEEVLAQYPANDSAIVSLMRLADVSDQRGNTQEAVNFLESVLDQFPGSPKVPGVILRQGELFSDMGDAQKAREKYQYILRVPDWRGPIHAQALFQTGESYLAEEKLAEAHGFFERTYLGYSHFAEWAGKAYLADAETLIKMGNTQDAIAVLTEALELLADSATEDMLQTVRDELQNLQS